MKTSTRTPANPCHILRSARGMRHECFSKVASEAASGSSQGSPEAHPKVSQRAPQSPTPRIPLGDFGCALGAPNPLPRTLQEHLRPRTTPKEFQGALRDAHMDHLKPTHRSQKSHPRPHGIPKRRAEVPRGIERYRSIPEKPR